MDSDPFIAFFHMLITFLVVLCWLGLAYEEWTTIPVNSKPPCPWWKALLWPTRMLYRFGRFVFRGLYLDARARYRARRAYVLRLQQKG